MKVICFLRVPRCSGGGRGLCYLGGLFVVQGGCKMFKRSICCLGGGYAVQEGSSS